MISETLFPAVFLNSIGTGNITAEILDLSFKHTNVSDDNFLWFPNFLGVLEAAASFTNTKECSYNGALPLPPPSSSLFNL